MLPCKFGRPLQEKKEKKDVGTFAVQPLVDTAVLDVKFMKLPGWSCTASCFFLTLVLAGGPDAVGGIFGLAGQGVTKIASGRLELRLA
eukprot:508379-Pelagomonas_calceolata.AAC.1